MTEAANLISSIGFPIVIALFMAWYIKYLNDQHREETKELNASHKAEMSEVTQAINNNTLVIQKLIDSLGVMKGSDSNAV